MMLKTLDALLEHIKEVQKDAVTLSQEAQLKVSSFIEKAQVELNAEVAEAFQHQDIVAQQLNATIEAIESAQTFLQASSDEEKSDDTALKYILEKAQRKREAFSGQSKDEDDKHEIEFF